ncbi:MAG: hypothetical protein M3P43_02350 [Actinomycetota bacterium]|nr:hypothetical protein [Actinomycetota bacterium]
MLQHGAEIVRGYDTGVTLRQLFYRMVADGTLPNTLPTYKTLSARTAEARRDGWFPTLVDLTRSISRPPSWSSPGEAREALRDQYRQDRTAGQEFAVYLGVEKATLLALFESWYDEHGLPIVVTRGYGSQTYVDAVDADVSNDGRKAVLLYVGDLDPSGEDIERDFIERTDAFDDAKRVAVRPEHVAHYGLVPAPGKATDSRAAGFTARHGELIQVEVEALDPNDLRVLVDAALEPYWDVSAFEAVLAQEEQERRTL